MLVFLKCLKKDDIDSAARIFILWLERYTEVIMEKIYGKQ